MYDSFSVVISLYRYDIPAFFRIAFNSLLDQSLAPSEIIVVIDGPIGPELLAEVSSISSHSFVRPLFLPDNVGRGAARHHGILHATYDLVALMDSDDICLNNRFRLQIDAIKCGNYDVIGGQIAEFNSASQSPTVIRSVPLSHLQIVRWGRLKQPFNHVSLLIRKSAYFSAGGYRSLRYIEDYDLYHRMLQSGALFANLPEVIVYVRCDGQVARRRGLPYLIEELDLYRDMLSTGYISFFIFLFNIALRILFRFAPLFVIEWLSSLFLRAPFKSLS